MFKIKNFKGSIKTNFIWIIPLIIGLSKNIVGGESVFYSLHITPFIEISFNYKGTRNGYE